MVPTAPESVGPPPEPSPAPWRPCWLWLALLAPVLVTVYPGSAPGVTAAVQGCPVPSSSPIGSTPLLSAALVAES
jgi:hypothetical protein